MIGLYQILRHVSNLSVEWPINDKNGPFNNEVYPNDSETKRNKFPYTK